MTSIQPGQVFRSTADSQVPAQQSDDSLPEAQPARPPSFQPSHVLEGDLKGDKLAFDMAAAGHIPINWTRPHRDLYFVMQQLGISDRCRAHRLLGDEFKADLIGRSYCLVSIRQIGDKVNPGDDEIDRWLNDIGFPGLRLVDRAYVHLSHPTDEHEALFKASRHYDPSTKSTSYTLPVLPPASPSSKPPIQCLPRAGTSVERSFAMRELTLRETIDAADAVEDPDMGMEVRVMQVMFSICRIGGRALRNTPDDLLLKRSWLSDIGPRAFMLVAGTYSRMHEVDRGLVDRFLVAAEALA